MTALYKPVGSGAGIPDLPTPTDPQDVPDVPGTPVNPPAPSDVPLELLETPDWRTLRFAEA